MTGRGLRLVNALSSEWGFEAAKDGKTVWAELVASNGSHSLSSGNGGERSKERSSTTSPATNAPVHSSKSEKRHRIVLGDIPTDLLLAAKSHIDNLVREFTLAALGADSGTTTPVPAHLAEMVDSVIHAFAEPRAEIKRQAVAAARRHEDHVRLELELPLSAAETGARYLAALDEADAYCHAERMLTLATPPQHKLFRHWYVEEIMAALHREAVGEPAVSPMPFEKRMLDEIGTVAKAHERAARATRLYRVVNALSSAPSVNDVARAVLEEGIKALGADNATLSLDAAQVSKKLVQQDRLRGSVVFLNDLETNCSPSLLAFESGPVWVESAGERDELFPDLIGAEPETISLCSVPLETSGHRLGALCFSFREPRLFDPDERQFITTLGRQCAQALERAELLETRADASQRLQRSLLPPSLPPIPEVDVAALYQPLASGLELGGDFYDLWSTTEGWAFAIGDACGTGPEAAALSARVRFSLRALSSLSGLSSSGVLEQLDSILRSYGDDDDERFCTTIYANLRREADQFSITLASGGHPGPLVRYADATVREFELNGSIVGTLANPTIAEVKIPLNPGDLVVFFTDGLTEARRDHEQFGIERLAEALRSCPGNAQGCLQSIKRALTDFAGSDLSDDMAIVVIGVRS